MTEAERNWMEPDYVADDDTFYIRAGKTVVIFERGTSGSPPIVRQRSFESAIDASNFLIKKRDAMIARNGAAIPWSRRARSGRGLY